MKIKLKITIANDEFEKFISFGLGNYLEFQKFVDVLSVHVMVGAKIFNFNITFANSGNICGLIKSPLVEICFNIDINGFIKDGKFQLLIIKSRNISFFYSQCFFSFFVKNELFTNPNNFLMNVFTQQSIFDVFRTANTFFD